MSSQTREIVHDQHAHPTNAFYLKIGAVLIGLTALEVVGYIGEVNHWYSQGIATLIILGLSAVKFYLVVALYMHLKYDHKLFTGVFVFPMLLGTLVIVGMILLFHVLHGTSTGIHGTPTTIEGVSGAGTTPSPN